MQLFPDLKEYQEFQESGTREDLGESGRRGVSYTIRPRIERGKKNVMFVVYFYELKDNQHRVLG